MSMTDVDTDAGEVTDAAAAANGLDAAADSGAGDADWRAGLSDGLREDATLGRYKSVEELAKGYLHTKALVGREDRVILPGKDAAPEEWDKFYQAVGRPDDASGYELAMPEGVPEGFSYSETAKAEFKEWAHEAGLTPAQASLIHDRFVESAAKATGDAAAQAEIEVGDADKALRESWGRDHERNVQLAGRAIDVLGGDDLVAALKARGVLAEDGAVRDPVIARAFSEAGSMLGEDILVGGDDNELPGPARAKEELKAFESDPENRDALLNSMHARHNVVKEQRSKLYQLAYPRGTAAPTD